MWSVSLHPRGFQHSGWWFCLPSGVFLSIRRHVFSVLRTYMWRVLHFQKRDGSVSSSTQLSDLSKSAELLLPCFFPGYVVFTRRRHCVYSKSVLGFAVAGKATASLIIVFTSLCGDTGGLNSSDNLWPEDCAYFIWIDRDKLPSRKVIPVRTQPIDRRTYFLLLWSHRWVSSFKIQFFSILPFLGLCFN